MNLKFSDVTVCLPKCSKDLLSFSPDSKDWIIQSVECHEAQTNENGLVLRGQFLQLREVEMK